MIITLCLTFEIGTFLYEKGFLTCTPSIWTVWGKGEYQRFVCFQSNSQAILRAENPKYSSNFEGWDQSTVLYLKYPVFDVTGI